jgi:hypothetical protein
MPVLTTPIFCVLPILISPTVARHAVYYAIPHIARGMPARTRQARCYFLRC